MATLRPDNVLNEFTFSEEEEKEAKRLTPLQVQWIHTKYAQLFKQKASILIPENMEMDRSFLLKVSELEGRLNAYQELLDECIAVEQQIAAESRGEGSVQTVGDLAKTAANLVNVQQEL